MSQTLGTSSFRASALELKPEGFAVNVTEVYLIVNEWLQPCIQQLLGTISEVWAYLAQLKVTTPWQQD